MGPHMTMPSPWQWLLLNHALRSSWLDALPFSIANQVERLRPGCTVASGLWARQTGRGPRDWVVGRSPPAVLGSPFLVGQLCRLKTGPSGTALGDSEGQMGRAAPDEVISRTGSCPLWLCSPSADPSLEDTSRSGCWGCCPHLLGRGCLCAIIAGPPRPQAPPPALQHLPHLSSGGGRGRDPQPACPHSGHFTLSVPSGLLPLAGMQLAGPVYPLLAAPRLPQSVPTVAISPGPWEPLQAYFQPLPTMPCLARLRML